LKAVILAGADLLPTGQLRSEVAGAELVIAADGGLRHAAALGLTPGFIIGDFDSVTAADLELHPGSTRLRFPAGKDELDLELALDLARREGAASVLIIGATSGRLDQTLAALLIAARWQQQLPLALHDGVTSAWPLAGGDSLELQLPGGAPFSLLSLEGNSSVSISGAAWPLDHATLGFGTGQGVSNSAAATEGGNALVSVSVHAGLAVLIVERRKS
jgi:thiamine pyrophosphokinase